MKKNPVLYLIKIKSTILCSGISLLSLVFLAIFQDANAQTRSTVVNIVFTSDAHYGISRAKFRGDTSVSGHQVNAAMISQINNLPNLELPPDGGVNAGNKVNAIDFVIEGGDITNRMEPPVQSSELSWQQFQLDYMQKLKAKNQKGQPARLLIIPGNHDISNAIGFYKPMRPHTDPTAMVNIYNLMCRPNQPLTNQSYDYHQDKINYSLNIQGIHLQLINLWPDSAERIWMAKDLDTVAATTPVIIFTHDQPTSEPKHFTNPKLPNGISPEFKFENLAEEHYKDSLHLTGAISTDVEQRGWVKFLKNHTNIRAYFHGNSNWNEYYIYHGPDNDVNLCTFRVDSPMKGKYSAQDETRLSFMLISLDQEKQILTARECLWNTTPLDPQQKIFFGNSTTISLKTK